MGVNGGEGLCCEGGDISLSSVPPFVRVENAGGKHGAGVVFLHGTALLAGQAAVSIPGYIAFG